jgi:uroporphyrinogen-III decarboxylase
MFNPELFGQVYTPAWRTVNDVIHEFDDVKVWIHSCGAVGGFVPYFIEAGVDILNPIQWTAAGMDLQELKNRYGDKLTFWGGAISTQRTFPFGTPEDVGRETRGVLDIMAPGGGYVVNPIHNILPEVPPENIVAMYRTAQEYRYSR